MMQFFARAVSSRYAAALVLGGAALSAKLLGLFRAVRPFDDNQIFSTLPLNVESIEVSCDARGQARSVLET